jgi:hypothetical protein
MYRGRRTRAGPEFGGEPLQFGDPVLGRRMGRKQTVDAVTRQRVDDEQMRGRWIAFSLHVRDLVRGVGDLDQRGHEHIGWPTMRVPRLSAAYSRVRLIAVCTDMAPNGARIIIAIEPMMPGPLLLSR